MNATVDIDEEDNDENVLSVNRLNIPNDEEINYLKKKLQTQVRHSECQVKMKENRLKHQQNKKQINLTISFQRKMQKINTEKIHLIYEWKKLNPGLESKFDMSQAERILEDINDKNKNPSGSKRKTNPNMISNNLSTARLLLEKREIENILEKKKKKKKETLFYNLAIFTKIDANVDLKSFAVLPFSLSKSQIHWKENLTKIMTHTDRPDTTFEEINSNIDNLKGTSDERFSIDSQMKDEKYIFPKIFQSNSSEYFGPVHTLQRSRRRTSVNKVTIIQEALNKMQSKREIKNLQKELYNLHLSVK